VGLALIASVPPGVPEHERWSHPVRYGRDLCCQTVHPASPSHRPCAPERARGSLAPAPFSVRAISTIARWRSMLRQRRWFTC